MRPRRIVTVVGARPQFIKAAPVSRRFADLGIAEEVLVHTGQHHDAVMSQVFFDELGIPAPRHFLGIAGGSHGEMTGRMLPAIETVLFEERPAAVIVYGDTNSTLAGALAAAKLGIPIAHVEAGLRSFNRAMPEEINRVMADHLAQLLLAPTHAALENLAREGLAGLACHVGDVMMDAALTAAPIAETRSEFLPGRKLKKDEYVLATLHRAENTDDGARLATLLSYVRENAGARSVVLPLHPRTAQAVRRFGIDLEGFDVCKPLGFLDMVSAIRGSHCIFTDSGGLQKECYFHRVPCITLREETEWVETVEAGWNRLWREPTYRERRDIPDYGDGRAAEAICDRVLELIGA